MAVTSFADSAAYTQHDWVTLDSLITQKDLPKALELVNTWLQTDPKNIDIIRAKIDILEQQHNLNKALFETKRALSFWPDHSVLKSTQKRLLQSIRLSTGFSTQVDFHYQWFSFYQGAVGASYQVSYLNYPYFHVRAGSFNLYQFSNNASGFTAGGTLFIKERLRLSLDGQWGIKATVVPTQSYALEASYIIGDSFEPSLQYKFSQYNVAFINTIIAGLEAKIWNYISTKGRVFCAINSFRERKETLPTVSFAISVEAKPYDEYAISGGFAMDSEAFDPGTPYKPLSSYIGYNMFLGGRVALYGPIKLGVNLDYEFRSNNTQTFTLDALLRLSF